MKALFSKSRPWLFILLLLFVSPVFASSLSTPNLTPPASDISMQFLSQFFGTVGNVTHSQSGQIIGKMLGILNDGLLAFIVMFMGYTVTTTALRAAHEGSMQSSNKQVAFLILRMAMGVGLVLPNAATGYTVMQDIVMRSVTAGVALADDTWNAALTYLNNGGILVNTSKDDGSGDVNGLANALLGQMPGVQKTATQSKFSASANDVTKSPTKAAAQHIFVDEVCMLRSAYKEAHPDNPPPSSGVAPGGSSGVFVKPEYKDYHPEIDNKNLTIYFPGFGDKDHVVSHNYGKRCGQVTALAPTGKPIFNPTNDDSKLPVSPSMQQTLLKSAKTFPAVTKMVMDELPVAQRYEQMLEDEDKNNSAPVDTKSIANEAGHDLANMVLGYYNAVQLYASQRPCLKYSWRIPFDASSVYCSQYDTSNPNYEFINNAKRDGWMMAGRYYWDLEKFNDAQQATVDVSKSAPFVQSYQADSLPADIVTQLGVAEGDFQPYASNASAQITDYEKALGRTNIDNNQTGAVSSGDNSNKILAAFLSAFNGVYDAFAKPLHNPIQYLMNIGHACLSAIHNAFTAAFWLAFGLATGMGICNSESPGGKIWQSLNSWAQSLCMLIIAALAVPGVTLSFYVPLYPYILFTFCSIGWMIIVLEAMVAAPLVCYGLTHPENHDFLGQAQQAIMLLLSVFLRPVLLVVGLIAAIVLSYISLRLLIYGFTGVLHDVFGVSGTSGVEAAISHASSGFGGLAGVIGFIGMLTMFGGMVFTLLQQSFSVVYALPNGIMKWVGSQGVQDSSPAQLAQQIQGYGSAVAGQAGKMAEVGVGAGKVLGQGGGAAAGAVKAAVTGGMDGGADGAGEALGQYGKDFFG
ncbi:MAG: DotA/TraY family protein [Gammaproteobacteria bacterium]|nr:DotA/TraY family protein [Gammaproteobacteria bacterium]